MSHCLAGCCCCYLQDVAQTPKVKRALDAMFKKKEEETEAEADEEEAADEEA